ncbi:MAG: class I SAM-dependent methyltransferase [Terriglobales bacterium]
MKKLAKLLLLAAPAGAVAVGAITYYEYRKQRLEQEAERLWELLALKPGSRVGDVGAGTGDITALIAARIGPAGRIYAIETDPVKLRKLERRKQKAGWNQVEVIAATPNTCNIPENSCDAVYMRGVYHHLTDPAAMDVSLLRALRPGGTLAVIDFAPRLLLAPWTPKGIPSNRGGHGIRRELTTAELERAGFDAVRAFETWPGGCYCVLFQKPIAA